MSLAPPVFVDATFTQDHADALERLSMAYYWKGWRMQCRCCGRFLAITSDGGLIEHRDGCPTAYEQHPWAQLRALLGGVLPAAAPEAPAQ